jgi:16S rRNA (cytidine1402-2'-O)-methyltransferase
MAVIREAPKIHEEILRGPAAELAALKREWKGELVVGVSPQSRNSGNDSGDGDD